MPPAVFLADAVALAGGYPVLAGLSLRVEEGEAVLLQGPNGAGKTSLLRVCAGLLGLSAGRAQVLGFDLRSDRESLRREIGLVAHSSLVYEDLSVVDNLVFALRAARAERGRAEAALERLGLGGRLASTRVSRLSAGQRRRLSIAIVFARAPRLWLLDEPHAGLDESGRNTLDELVREATAGGATVLVASHEVERAATLTTRTVAIAGGRAEEVERTVVATRPCVGVA